MISLEHQERIYRLATVICLLFPISFVAIPYLWMTLCSFAVETELYGDNAVPLSFSLANFETLLEH